MGAAKETFAIGIDLGTTYSCVGIWRSDRVEIIADKENVRHTPSCVAFTEELNEDDKTYTNRRLIGEDALNEDDCIDTNIIYDSKRLIGRRFNEETVQSDMKQCRWPFKVSEGSDGKAMISVTCKNKGETKNFAPEEISAMVLGRLKKTVEEFLGAEVKDAVITVPYKFDQSQRQATIDAGNIAGLNVLRLLNEPTAAAVAYTLNLDLDTVKEKKVLVFDLGGGTFDVSCLVVTKNKIEVKAVGGDAHLGGQDFVNRMVDHFIGVFKTKHNIDITDISKHSTALRELKKACERGKRSLSSEISTNIRIDSLPGKKEKLTRAKFEELNLDLFKKCMDCVEKCLVDANMNKNDVDDVVLIGGSSSIPKIREMLSKLMDRKELYQRIDPFEAVASGAAVQAALLSGRGSGKIQKLMLFDVAPLSLGIEIAGDVMRVLIPKNTSIPARFEKCFTTTKDYQTTLTFSVYEGERARSKDNKLLGQLELSGIKPALRRVPNVDVCFNLQADGILEVTAKDRDTGKEISTTMKGMKLPGDEIQRMIKESKEYEAIDEMFKKKGEARNDFEIYACRLRDEVNSGHGVKAEEKEKAKKAIDEALEWLDSKVQLAEVSEYEERKKKLMSVVDEARKGN